MFFTMGLGLVKRPANMPRSRGMGGGPGGGAGCAGAAEAYCCGTGTGAGAGGRGTAPDRPRNARPKIWNRSCNVGMREAVYSSLKSSDTNSTMKGQNNT